MTYRGVIELIRDANTPADTRRSRRRPGPRPKPRNDLLVVDYAAHGRPATRDREAVTMANDDGKSFARLAADEWRANLRRNRADAGPQGRTACGTVSADGYCMSRTHSMACADTMTSAVSRATFAVPGSAEADRLWVAAKAERERTVAMFRSPAEAAAMAERDRQAAEAEAARDRRAAEGDTVANWAASGRGIGWLAQTLAHGTR